MTADGEPWRSVSGHEQGRIIIGTCGRPQRSTAAGHVERGAGDERGGRRQQSRHRLGDVLDGVGTAQWLLRVAGWFAPHCTGAGKALLAFSPPEVVDAVLDRLVLAAGTPATITDRTVLAGAAGGPPARVHGRP